MVDTGILNWTLHQFLSMMVIMTRVAPLIFFMPVLGSRNVPAQVKILFTLMTALVLVPVIDVSPDVFPTSTGAFLLFLGYEVLYGIVLAVYARLIFAAMEIAGQMVGMMMGMGMAATMDPQFGSQISLIGYFWNLVTILIFLSIDGHHIFFRALVESFNWVDPGTLSLSRATFDGVMKGVTDMFVLSIQVMAPAMAALFFAHVAGGIIAKVVPQIPILIVAMPMNIAVGLVFVMLSLAYFLPLMMKNFDLYGSQFLKLAAGMGG